MPNPPSAFQRLRYKPCVFYPTLVFGILSSILVFGYTLIALFGDIERFQQQLVDKGLILSVKPAKDDQILILIATFDQPGIGLPVSSKPQEEIQRALVKAMGEYGLSQVIVKTIPIVISVDDKKRANFLGKRYNASAIIWGSETGVRITVNYLNLINSDDDISYIQLSETEHSQISIYTNPNLYLKFITVDLPTQMIFFSSLAISDAFIAQENYEMSLSTIKKTLTDHSLESISPEIISAAYTRIGRLFSMKPDFIEKSSVIEYLSRAIQINPKNHEAYNYRAFVYMTQHDFDKALADFDQLFVIDPQNAASYSDRGSLYSVMGEFKKGLSDVNHAIELEPDNATFYNNRAVLYYNINDFDNALSDYNQSILLDSEDPTTYINRGIAYESSGDISNAVADYSRSIKIDPGNGAAYYYRGTTFYELGEFDKALNDLLIALKLGGPENRKFAEDYIFKIQTKIKGPGRPSPNPEP